MSYDDKIDNEANHSQCVLECFVCVCGMHGPDRLLFTLVLGERLGMGIKGGAGELRCFDFV